MKIRLIVTLIICGLACTAGKASPLIDVEGLAPGLILDIRYHSSDNFVGAPIAGYNRAKCLLTKSAATALAAAQNSATARGLSLKVFDCYRPQQAVDQFVRWAKDLNDTRKKPGFYPYVFKSELFAKGYIAEKSGHSRGSTVDLTLVSVDTGKALDMGTPFDFFDPLSHTDNPLASTTAQQNRRLLRSLMTAQGFKNLPQEWWHYTLISEPFPDTYFNVPVE